jgi:hydroxymethylbilane synthase
MVASWFALAAGSPSYTSYMALTLTPPPISELTIATRESRLALWQANHVKVCLEAAHPGLKVSLLGMTTEGDQRLDVSLSKIGGKGLFIKELETALQDGRAQLAVHSLKDVPVELPPGFTLACVMEREDPRDAFVSNQYASLADLPSGAVVGTSSLRREVQLRERFAHLRIEPLRGNLDTRLRKLDEGHYAAIILAYAGLKRLGLGPRIKQLIAPEDMLPAAAQGALGIEVLSSRDDVTALLQPLVHLPTLKAITAERAVLKAMGGSCTMPIGAYCVEDARGFWLRAVYQDAAGLKKAEATTRLTSDLADLAALGSEVAQKFVSD